MCLGFNPQQFHVKNQGRIGRNNTRMSTRSISWNLEKKNQISCNLWLNNEKKYEYQSPVSKSDWPVDQHSSSKGKKMSNYTTCFMKVLAKTTWATPWSHPLITSPFPILNLKGLPRSLDESNFLPFSKVPKDKKK